MSNKFVYSIIFMVLTAFWVWVLNKMWGHA
jgi:hypothetical protein